MAKKTRFKKEKECYTNKDGSEKLCSKPLSVKGKINAPKTLREKMKELWTEFRVKEEEYSSIESIADAQDFDMDDDSLPRTPYESEGEIADYLGDPQSEYVEISENQNDNVTEEQQSEEGESK
jgi:hypothetical protein